jgi:membrane dipeptidase
VIGLNFYRDFVGGTEDLDAVTAHLEHILALGGEQAVALGGDWDGCDTIDALPAVTDLPRLYEHLLRRNYRESLLRELFFHNLMRVVNRP